MTSKNKTGDKLVASIRKSKSGTVASKTGERPAAGQSDVKTKSPTVGQVPASRPASPAVTNQDRKDSYSSGRRVWPD